MIVVDPMKDMKRDGFVSNFCFFQHLSPLDSAVIATEIDSRRRRGRDKSTRESSLFLY